MISGIWIYLSQKQMHMVCWKRILTAHEMILVTFLHKKVKGRIANDKNTYLMFFNHLFSFKILFISYIVFCCFLINLSFSWTNLLRRSNKLPFVFLRILSWFVKLVIRLFLWSRSFWMISSLSLVNFSLFSMNCSRCWIFSLKKVNW